MQCSVVCTDVCQCVYASTVRVIDPSARSTGTMVTYGTVIEVNIGNKANWGYMGIGTWVWVHWYGCYPPPSPGFKSSVLLRFTDNKAVDFLIKLCLILWI